MDTAAALVFSDSLLSTMILDDISTESVHRFALVSSEARMAVGNYRNHIDTDCSVENKRLIGLTNLSRPGMLDEMIELTSILVGGYAEYDFELFKNLKLVQAIFDRCMGSESTKREVWHAVSVMNYLLGYKCAQAKLKVVGLDVPKLIQMMDYIDMDHILWNSFGVYIPSRLLLIAATVKSSKPSPTFPVENMPDFYKKHHYVSNEDWFRTGVSSTPPAYLKHPSYFEWCSSRTYNIPLDIISHLLKICDEFLSTSPRAWFMMEALIYRTSKSGQIKDARKICKCYAHLRRDEIPRLNTLKFDHDTTRLMESYWSEVEEKGLSFFENFDRLDELKRNFQGRGAFMFLNLSTT